MRNEKQKLLEAAGWRVGSVRDFLSLTDAEAELVEMRLALAAALRERRVRLHLSQATLAQRLGSSQSRVAKMEAGDPSVSLDLLVRALLTTGATRREVGRAIAAPAG